MATTYTAAAYRFTRNADGTLATEASDLGIGAGTPVPTTVVVVGTPTNPDLPVSTSYSYRRTRYSDGEVWGWEYFSADGTRMVIFND